MNEHEDDLMFMQRTSGWPAWPMLPMKRRHSGQVPDAGVLFSNTLYGTPSYKWYPGLNIWESKETYAEAEKSAVEMSVDDLQSLLDDGWEVD